MSGGASPVLYYKLRLHCLLGNLHVHLDGRIGVLPRVVCLARSSVCVEAWLGGDALVILVIATMRGSLSWLASGEVVGNALRVSVISVE